MSEDRRRFKRVPVKIPVRIFLSGQEEAILGEIRNISEGGAFIHSEQHIAKGEKVLLELKFAQLELLHCRVTDIEQDIPKNKKTEASVVRWIKQLTENGFGVEFINLRPDVKKFLRELIEYCD